MDDSKLNMLRKYLAMGWALVPLHHVTNLGHGPACSCREALACKSAGKHPRLSAWQRPENLVRTEAALLPWPAETNWGLATGVVSGVWALDVDPKNGGREAVDQLHAAGLLQRTRVHWTGSGGMHLLYRIPGDFTPTNRTGALPPGIDVRGDGGQIVLPPSVSGVGAYRLDGTLPLEPADAFPALLELIRPAPVRHVPRVIMARVDPGGRYAAYARRAVDGELTSLRQTHSSRNSRAWAAAVRVIELCNAPWAELDGDDEYDRWREAGHAHPAGVDVPPSELDAIWRSALRHVGGREASGPADRPWPPAGDVEVLDFLRGPIGSDTGVNDPFAPVPSGRPPVLTLPVGTPVDAGATPAGVVDPVDALIGSMLTAAQLRALPPPRPLINGIVDMATTAWLIGPSGSYKSFVALDWAAHVGLGRDWHGHAVTQGLSVYIVAEGATGIRLRVDAWERTYGPMKDVLFLPRPIQADERRATGEWTTLVQACARLKPVLVIVDTQARVTVGIEENSATDMGVYIEQADRIKRETGACVLTVHHSGRTGTDARGSSALDGAQDAELRVERGDDGKVLLYADKQKDQAQLDPIELTMRLVDGGSDPDTGRDLSSLVIVETSRTLQRRERHVVSDEELIGKVGAAALLLGEHFATAGGTKAEIRALLVEHGVVQSAKKSTWYRVWQDLLKRTVIGKIHGSQTWRYVSPDDRARLVEPVTDDPEGRGGMYAP